jgi:hypothetical protein
MVGFVDTHDNQKNYSEKLAGKDPGPYVGTVKFTDDPLRQGRLGVNIPELTRTNNPTLDDCIWCQYLSPFYGAKSIEATNPSDPSDYRLTQHSYGMWFVPPDIDTQVLVMFARGEASQKNAFWIGCVQQPLTNQQVPGYGASTFTELAADRSTGRERGAAANRTSETQNYGTDLLPVGEKNRRMVENAVSAESANSFRYPVNRILADQLESQGLIQDPVRGTTTSSAKREAPSQVFGINTPGRIRDDSRELNIGPGGTLVKTDRNPGHSFVMDDGAEDGTNQLTRLRTASGHQLLMNDSEGVVYLANGSGKAFLEMAKDGTISLYSDGGINLRSGRDFNLHSDMNINFHAKGAINFTSETNVALNAEGYLFAMGDQGVFTSSQNGSVRTYARDGISSDTKGSQLHGARGGDIHLAASGTGPAGRFGGQIHFNSTSPSDKWGPIWLKPDSDYVRIKVSGGPGKEIDIDDNQPFINGKVKRRENRTTVTDFVTHEPYGRKSSTQQKKDYVNEAISQIKKASVVNDAIEQIKRTSPGISSTELERIKAELMEQPTIKAVADQLGKFDKIKLPIKNLNDLGVSSTELELIKSELLKQPTIKAVADQLGKVVKLNDQIKMPIANLNNLLDLGSQIQTLIDDPKLALENFVVGQASDLLNLAKGNIADQLKSISPIKFDSFPINFGKFKLF